MGFLTNICKGNAASGVSEVTDTHSVVFDGSNETISFGDVLDKSNTDPWSFALWLKADSYTGNRVIISKEISTGTLRGWGAYSTGGNPVTIYLFNDNGSANYLGFSVNNILDPLDTWVHLCCTFNGGTIATTSTYRNGVSVGKSTVSDTLTGTLANAAPLRLGARGVSAGSFWAGHIDWPIIVGRVLTSGEVSELYNSGAPSDPMLMSFASDIEWAPSLGEAADDLESASGVLDYSGNNYHGTAANMTNASNKSTDIPS